MMNSEDWKRNKYEEQLKRSICNKFVNNYFYTVDGIKFCKDNKSANYYKPQIDKDALKELEELGKQIIEEQKAMAINQSNLTMKGEIDQKAANDIYAYHKATAGVAAQSDVNRRPFRIKTGNTMSVFKQMEKERKLQEERNRQNNMEYLAKMTKEYDIYGQPRKQLEPVFSMFRGKPEFEYNDRTISIEAATDKRVMISSLAKRTYLHAPSVTETRKAGKVSDHKVLMKTLDKGNTSDGLEERKNLMPTSKTQDKLERDLVVYPHLIDFGTVRPGACYKAEMVVINDNYLLQRIKLVDPVDSNVKVTLSQNGPIAMGQERRVTVYLDADNLEEGEIDTEFYIMSRYRKYIIPVKAKLGPNVEDRSVSGHKSKKYPGGIQLKKIVGVDLKSGNDQYMDSRGSGGAREQNIKYTYVSGDEIQGRKSMAASQFQSRGFNEVHKKYQSLFEVEEIDKYEIDQVKTRTAGKLRLS